MDTLALVQELHREGKFPGTAPSTIVGQTGRAADLVAWTIEANNDIQRENDGRWRWLYGNWTLDTTASQAAYAYTAINDVQTAAAIARFRSWEIDEQLRPLIYLTADGVATQREMSLSDWFNFRYHYLRGTHDAAYPYHIAIGPDNSLNFGPTPDAVYTATGNYWKSNLVLAADADEPEFPADYHMLVVWRAIVKYAYNQVAGEILARAKTEGGPLFDQLKLNQSWSRFTLREGGALA